MLQEKCEGCHARPADSLHRNLRGSCRECHTQQRGPWVFEHQATRDGCSACHNPHGSPNQKMLTERNHTLCLKCHIQDQTAGATSLRIGGGNHSTGRLSAGACWAVW